MNEDQAEMAQFEKDISYAENHHEELLNQYPEQWIAILGQQVVGASTEAYQLIADLKKKGIPTEWVVVRHLTQQEELLIL